MPARVVRGEINASRSLARVSLQADLTFRALISAVDDYGRSEADPLMLKATLFPRRPDVSPDDVARWVAELEDEGCVQIYEVDGVALLCLTGWERHRGNARRSGQSKYPPPPSRKSGTATAGATSTPELPGASRKSGSVPEIREMRGNPSENRESGIGNRESRDEGREGGAGGAAPPPAPPTPKAPRKASRTAPPEALEPAALDRLRAWCQAKHPALAPRLADLVEACLTFHRGKGNLAADWYATCQTWVRNEAEQRFGRAGPAPPQRPEPGGSAYRPFVPERRDALPVVSVLSDLRKAVRP